MSEIKSFNLEACSLATVQDYWKMLGKLCGKEAYVSILHNGLILSIENEKIAVSLYSPTSSAPILEHIEFAYFLLSGYFIVGDSEKNVYLYGPKGKLKMKFVYHKNYYTSVIETREKGVPRFCSGYMFMTQFAFLYNTIAIRCHDKCYLAKANKLDLRKLFYVGEYEKIADMKDSKEGLVYVLYNSGVVKLFDNKFKEINLVQGVKKIVFLENGDFFAIVGDEYYLYDKNAKFVNKFRNVSVSYNDRFYKIINRIYDCHGHKECVEDIVPIFKKSGNNLCFEKGNVFFNSTFKKKGFNALIFRDALFGLTKRPNIINKKFLTFEEGDKQFVIELWKSDEETKKQLIDFIKKETLEKDFELDVFNYFKQFSSYLIRDEVTFRNMLIDKLS